MEFLKDEGGQGAAEFILLFGGVIVIAVEALLIYRAYFSNNTSLNEKKYVSSIRENIK
jgi:hypothetical protein